jgi:uncharacterized flavoprotein (TIGR03862 family)
MDVAVIGGGPGGLMAAEVLARGGAAVTVFERMRSPGRKLILAGRGGLNLTHSEPAEVFLDRYGPARPRIGPAVEAFTPDDLRAWSAGLGQDTFVGTSGRVFPQVLRATPLLRAWLRRLADLGVEIRTRTRWEGWDAQGRLRLTGPDGVAVPASARATLLAMGGASWPRVGSDGTWVEILRAAGIEVTPLRPANCGFTVPWSEPFATRFAGTPLKNIALSHNGTEVRGEALVTIAGLEGNAVYALSAALRDAIDAKGTATLTVDLRPDRTQAQLTARLDRRRPDDSATTALRRAWGLPPVMIGLLREATANQLPPDPAELAALAKHCPITLTAPQPLADAISTAGGIALPEVDQNFMLHKLPGVFAAGEMLDWEAPTGGYLLQATFSTAVAAAHGALAWLSR